MFTDFIRFHDASDVSFDASDVTCLSDIKPVKLRVTHKRNLIGSMVSPSEVSSSSLDTNQTIPSSPKSL